MPTSLLSAPVGSAAPIENSPPGIHTMPAGAVPGDAAAFGTVDANARTAGNGTDAFDEDTDVNRLVVMTNAMTAAVPVTMAPTTSGPRRRGRCLRGAPCLEWLTAEI